MKADDVVIFDICRLVVHAFAVIFCVVSEEIEKGGNRIVLSNSRDLFPVFVCEDDLR